MLRRAPEMTLALGALHEYALTNGDFIVSSLNYRWKDDYCVQGNNFKAIEAHYGANPACNKAHGIIDASMKVMRLKIGDYLYSVKILVMKTIFFTSLMLLQVLTQQALQTLHLFMFLDYGVLVQ